MPLCNTDGKTNKPMGVLKNTIKQELQLSDTTKKKIHYPMITGTGLLLAQPTGR